MKAVTLILGSLLLAALASGHTLEKRGLRRQARDGDHGHHHGAHGHGHGGGRRNNRGGRGGRRNNRRNNRRNQARQAFESGGYLAATDDYSDSLPGYENGEFDGGATAAPDYAEYDDAAATEAPIGADDGYAGPDAAADAALAGGYDAPADDAADAYAAPGVEGDYAAPGDAAADALGDYDDLSGYAGGADGGDLADYANGADQQAGYTPPEARRNRRVGKSPAIGNNAFSRTGCPGGRLQQCINNCPGRSARVYAACVTGCGNRCN